MLIKTIKSGLLCLLVLVLIVIPGNTPGRSVPTASVTITIDPGHGGFDPGAVISGVSEKSVSLLIAKRVEELGEEYPALNFVFTRLTDDYISLLDRLEIAKQHGSDGYISIQANSFRDPNVTGVETILDWTRDRSSSSWNMAESVQQSVVETTGARDRGIRQQRLYTRHSSLPAALIEVGFLTSPAEREKLTSPAYQDLVAKGIIQGLLAYFSE
ncbi:MAG: N-acetylmuramoyl-L-alanine amidase family protein [Candidatus Bipolaricaulota bacterium]